ncbi:MAG TPA: DcaP family trimeric outer membrane transporter [Terriglobia bacterium]|nr:DcaP family trimeric outer membrane transporter [Terriglobia bacterium]
MLPKDILHLLFASFFLLMVVSGAAAQATTAPAQTPAAPRLDIYGFLMTDFGYDFRSNDPNWFDVNRPSKLPSFQNEFGRNGKTFVGVRQTRFGVKGSEPTPLGELKTQFEFDMFGVGPDAGQTTIRPRHYYAELGAFGVGQTHSPFMDIDIFPNILDYWGPNGMVFFRNVQVRWMPIRGDTRLTVALERPGSTQDPGILANRIEIQNVRARYPVPDLSGEFRYGWKGGYVKASGIVRKIKLDDLGTNSAINLDDSVLAWGADLSSNLKFGKDVLRLQYVYGDGIENYMNDAPVDVAAKPNFGNPARPVRGRALPMQSLVAFLDHGWTNKWTTSAGYSQLAISNTILQTPNAFHRGQYAIANLLYSPVEHVMYGVEGQWARRTNFADGFHANDYRIQFSFKYNFSAQIGGVK